MMRKLTLGTCGACLLAFTVGCATKGELRQVQESVRELNDRQTEATKRIDNVSANVGKIDKQTSALRGAQEKIDQNVSAMNEAVAALQASTKTLAEGHENTSQKLAALLNDFKTVQTGLNTLHREVQLIETKSVANEKELAERKQVMTELSEKYTDLLQRFQKTATAANEAGKVFRQNTEAELEFAKKKVLMLEEILAGFEKETERKTTAPGN